MCVKLVIKITSSLPTGSTLNQSATNYYSLINQLLNESVNYIIDYISIMSIDHLGKLILEHLQRMMRPSRPMMASCTGRPADLEITETIPRGSPGGPPGVNIASGDPSYSAKETTSFSPFFLGTNYAIFMMVDKLVNELVMLMIMSW